MNRIVRFSTARATALAVATAVVLFSLTACSGENGEETALQAEREAQLQQLEQQQQEVEAAREELARLQDRLTAAEAGDLPEGEEADPTALRVEIEQQDARITAMVEELNQALVDFINADPPIAGEPTPPLTEQALVLKADEDVALAREYITQGGDYARAIAIYEDILEYAPDHPGATEAKTEAERLRYMDEERFSQVETGMTQGEVEAILGPAKPRNRRVFEDRGLAAWYYPKNPDGDAAAVMFRQRDGRMQVYKVDFDAVQKADGDAEAEA